MNKKIKKIISALLVILWMFVIFFFSSMPADESDKQSKGIIYIIAEKLEGKDAEEIENINELNHIIRKCAHASVYFVLSILIFNFVNQIKEKNIKYTYYFYIIGICFLYACTDEFHQLFVEGRGGMFLDVCIDTAGASMGCILMALIKKLKNARRFKYE